MDSIRIDNKEFACRDLLERAIRSLKSPPGQVPRSRWFRATRVFAIGSTTAYALCREFGLDPDELV